MTDRLRNRRGRYTPDLSIAERDAHVTKLKAAGKTDEEIVALGIPGIGTHSAVSRALKRCVQAVRETSGEEYLTQQLALTEISAQVFLKQIEHPGYKIAPSGKVTDQEDETIRSQAATGLSKIADMRVKWLGLAAPAKSIHVNTQLADQYQANNQLIAERIAYLEQENANLKAQQTTLAIESCAESRVVDPELVEGSG